MSLLKAFMMEKPNIMYATIKGSLTENDGVFSGFGASNYLLGQTIITSEIQQQYLTSSEFKFKVTLPSTISAEEQIMYFPYKGILNGFSLRATKYIRWYVVSTDAYITSASTFELGSTIWIKGVIANNVATLYSSTDGTNWNNEGSVAITEIVPTTINMPIRIGVSGSSTPSGAWGGSIDLNRSYIKLGATKYNLQAVVGWTKVGSPTESPTGVFSGFSLNNYLQIPTNFTDNDFEILLKLEDVGTDNLARTIFQISGSSVYIGLSSTNKLMFNGISGFVFDSGFNTSGLLYIKAIKKGLDYSFGYSNDGITYTMLNKTLTEQVSTSSPNNILRSGNWSGIGVKLYVKDCYIKINNKLWFNGQEA